MKTRMKKAIAMIAALALFFAIGIGATLAYLNAITKPITNTFTMGNINIELTETTGTAYKLTPGTTTTKDPKVTVVAGSEKCYLFIEVKESTNLINYLDYSIADGWINLGLNDKKVFYREVMSDTGKDQAFPVLKGNIVTASSTATGIDVNTPVSLTFQAYAIQFDGIANVSAAWDAVSKLPNQPSGA